MPTFNVLALDCIYIIKKQQRSQSRAAPLVEKFPVHKVSGMRKIKTLNFALLVLYLYPVKWRAFPLVFCGHILFEIAEEERSCWIRLRSSSPAQGNRMYRSLVAWDVVSDLQHLQRSFSVRTWALEGSEKVSHLLPLSLWYSYALCLPPCAACVHACVIRYREMLKFFILFLIIHRVFRWHLLQVCTSAQTWYLYSLALASPIRNFMIYF